MLAANVHLSISLTSTRDTYPSMILLCSCVGHESCYSAELWGKTICLLPCMSTKTWGNVSLPMLNHGGTTLLVHDQVQQKFISLVIFFN